MEKQFLNFLNERTSIRIYKDQTIDPILLDELLGLAFRTSNTGNMQLYSVIITRDIAKKEQLAPSHFNQSMVKRAPVVLTFCADINRFNQWCCDNDANPGFNNFLGMYTASIDALLVAQTFCVAAEGVGLGICYLGTTIYNADKIVEVLNLPKGVVPVTTVTVGWPDEKPEVSERLPLGAVIHHEEYNVADSNDIKIYYSEKESLPQNNKFIVENDKQTLAQVYTDVRYKKADNEFFSQKFIDVIKKQGFPF